MQPARPRYGGEMDYSVKRLARWCLIIGVLQSNAWGAEVYRWVDEDGNVHFSDAPPEQHSAEKIVTQEHVPKPPDEGELRRRALLKQADAEAERILAEREAERAAHKQELEDQSRTDALCADARTRLAILNEQKPMHYDADGHLRAQWRQDPYQGARTYLSDAERASLRNDMESLVEERCGQAPDPASQTKARLKWIWSERCAVARAELEVMVSERSRTPRSEIEKQQGIVAFWCDD